MCLLPLVCIYQCRVNLPLGFLSVLICCYVVAKNVVVNLLLGGCLDFAKQLLVFKIFFTCCGCFEVLGSF